MKRIELIDVYKKFGDTEVSRGINLTIEAGTAVAIIGRSGEGKSVLLKQMIGLIRPTQGQILVDDIDITQLSDRELGETLRDFGYVFQFAALLDSLNTYENIGITLLERGKAHAEVKAIVEEKLRLVNLSPDALHKYPSELSGGMRKRVGLARTLVTNPTVVLYDEPTTGLDPITARIIHELMFDMQTKLKLTTVVVSHDTELFKYVDKVALLHNGVIQEVCDAKKIWDSQNPYVYQFIRGLTTGPIQLDTKK